MADHSVDSSSSSGESAKKMHTHKRKSTTASTPSTVKIAKCSEAPLPSHNHISETYDIPCAIPPTTPLPSLGHIQSPAPIVVSSSTSSSPSASTLPVPAVVKQLESPPEPVELDDIVEGCMEPGIGEAEVPVVCTKVDRQTKLATVVILRYSNARSIQTYLGYKSVFAVGLRSALGIVNDDEKLDMYASGNKVMASGNGYVIMWTTIKDDATNVVIPADYGPARYILTNGIDILREQSLL